jgi:hypothetical protein
VHSRIPELGGRCRKPTHRHVCIMEEANRCYPYPRGHRARPLACRAGRGPTKGWNVKGRQENITGRVIRAPSSPPPKTRAERGGNAKCELHRHCLQARWPQHEQKVAGGVARGVAEGTRQGMGIPTLLIRSEAPDTQGSCRLQQGRRD